MKITLQVISLIIIIAGLLPLIKKDHWTFRVFDFPRFQKFFLGLIILLIWVLTVRMYEIFDLAIICLLVTLMIYLIWQIFPFTPFGKKMIKDTAIGDHQTPINILVTNIYQENQQFTKVITLIEKENPDLFLLVETDEKWADAISVFKEEYPNFIEKPLDNTYGMVFYSKFPILNKKISYLIDDEVPSLEVDLELPEKGTLRVYAIHPTPPVPNENVKSTERDAEILIIAKKAKTYNKPCIVIGDLNDVAWSYTSELFLKISGLLDPRRGRGMFNTFHASYPLFRWPLDHIFISKHFTLDQLKVHKDIGSDHFPISTRIQLNLQNKNEEKEADQEEKKEADQKIINGKTGQEN